jgi:hypothetical protein
MRRNCYVIAFAAVGFLLALSMPRAQQATQSAPIYTAAQAAAGKTAYDVSCASCHGGNLDDGALALLTLFYLLAVPLAGVPQPGSEGTYLVVNKTLIEAAAVAVLLVFNTGAIAGLDLLLARRRAVAGNDEVGTMNGEPSGVPVARSSFLKKDR